MRLLLHTMATPQMTPVEALDLAARLGFDGIDLITQENYRCALKPRADLNEARALARAAAERGVAIGALTPYCKELNATDPARRVETVEAFRRAIEQAAALGASGVRVLAGTDIGEDEWEASLAILVDTIRPLGDFASEHGVGLNLENHDGTLADDAARTVRVWRAIDHPAIGIIYDPANLIRDGKEPFPENLTMQAEGIRAVHVKDYIFDESYPAGRCAMVIGEGVISWQEMLRGLRDIGFNGDLSLEYETRWVPEQLPDPVIGLGRSRKYLSKCLDDLGADV